MNAVAFSDEEPHSSFPEDEGKADNSVTAARFEVHPVMDSCVIREIARTFPELRLDVIRLLPMEDGLMLEDVQIEGDLTDQARVDGITNLLKGSLVEVLYRGEMRLLVRITVRICWLVAMFQSVNTMPVTPLSVKSGSLSFSVLAQSQKIRDLFEKFKEVDSTVKVSTLRNDRVVGSRWGLTPRQMEIFKLARSAGYWDTPRRVTQTEMAYLLNKSKSTVSETLATVERKVMRDGLIPSVT